MKRCLLNRIVSLVLALLIVCSQLCMNVFAQEDEDAYSANIGGTAKLNADAYIYISDDPTAGLGYENMLTQEKVAAYADMVFAIVDYYSDGSGYWYKLGATAGETLPTELAAKPWVYQNDIPDLGYYEDALIVSAPNTSIQLEEPYNTGIYSALIGSTGKLNFEQWTYLSVSDDPTIDLNDAQELQATDLPEWNLQLVVEAVHWQEDTNALWLKVAAAEGYTLPSKLQRYPWVYQNDTSWYSEEDWQDASPDSLLLTLPNNAQIDLATGVAVSGLPEDATLEVEVPTIGGETLSDVFDIKIYDADGNEWQPIDHGQTVTISIPVSAGIEYVDVSHIIDYAPAIHDNVEYVSIDGADAAVLEILAAAIEASDRQGYVAVDAISNILVVDGVAEFEANSFSLYLWSDANGFTQSGTVTETTVQFDNLTFGSQNGNIIEVYYATKDHIFKVSTKYGVTGSFEGDSPFDIFYGVKESTQDQYPGSYTTTVQNVQRTNAGSDGFTLLGGYKYKATFIIPETATPGEMIVIRFKASAEIYLVIKIVDLVDVTFDKNLAEASLTNTIYKDIVTDGDEEKAVFTIPNTTEYTPTVPEGSHYHFEGWNTSPDGSGDSYKPGDSFTPLRDMTLYAIWTADNYFVDYDLMNGAGNIPEKTLYANDTIITLPDAPTKANVTFLGWSATGDGYSTLYPAGFSYTVKADVTFHAIWGVDMIITVENGTLTLQKAGEFSARALEDHTYPNGEKIFEKADTNGVTTYKGTIIEGYLENAIFLFNHDSSLNAAVSSSNDAITFKPASATQTQAVVSAGGITTNTTLAFNATEGTTYYISFDPKGGTAVTPVAVKQNQPFPSAQAPEPAKPTRQGYQFLYWADKGGNKVDSIASVTANVTLYAVWSPHKYTIRLDVNGGNEVYASEGYEYNIENTSLQLPTPTKVGYTFVGWKVAETDGNWEKGKIYTGSFAGMYGDVTLTAQWERSKYDLTYNGPGVPSKSDKVEYGKEVAVDAPSTRQGYTFSGWKITGVTGKDIVSAGETFTMPANAVILTAQWATITYEISYYDATSDQASIHEYTIEDSITLMSPDAKEGYVFVGWKVTQAAGNWEINKQYDADQIDINAGMYGNVTLTAQWTVSVSAEIDNNGTIEIDWNGVHKTYDDGILPSFDVLLGTAEGATITFTPEEGYCIATINGQKPSNAELSDGKYIYTVPDGGITGPISIEVTTKVATTSMTISVRGAEGYSFIFSIIEETDDTDGLNMLVAVGGGSSVTIQELLVGTTYNVTELSGWSWKHVILDSDETTENTLIFSAERNSQNWLGGEG